MAVFCYLGLAILPLIIEHDNVSRLSLCWLGRPSYASVFRGRPRLSEVVTMAWIILVIAGLLEVIWAIGLKYSHGFSRLTPSIITLVAMAASVFLLAYAMKSLPAGTAYAVWAGIGAVGTAILGIVLLGESASLARILSLGLILAGIIGLKLAS